MGAIVNVSKSEIAALYSEESLKAFAKEIIKSKLLPQIKINGNYVDLDENQAVYMMKMGRELEVHPTQIANLIYPIPTQNGIRFDLKAEEKLALAIKRIPGFKCMPLEESAESCTLWMVRDGYPEYKFTYTRAQADQAGFSTVCPKNGTPYIKDQWKKQPEYMLYNRTLTMMLKKYCPEYKSPSVLIPMATLEEANTAIESLTGFAPEDPEIIAVSDPGAGKDYSVDTSTGEVLTSEYEDYSELEKAMEEETQANVEEFVQAQAKAEETPAKELFPSTPSHPISTKPANVEIVADCIKCGSGISGKVMTFSIAKHGKAYCYKCQQEMKGN